MDLQALRTIWAFPGESVLHECKLSSSGQSRKECLVRGLSKCPNNGYAKPASRKEGAICTVPCSTDSLPLRY